MHDGSGKRIMKSEHDATGEITARTWYAYDASGGLVGTYEQPAGAVSATQVEVPIGASSHLGVFYRQVPNVSIYQLTDHLGNVRATFRRDSTLEEWTDYDAWGTPLEGRRQLSTLTYRYAYQGQETEKVGTVSTTAFQLRAWDTRIGRWTAPDPYGQYVSAYVGMGNNPVSMIDPDGGWAGGPGWVQGGRKAYQLINLEKGRLVAATWTRTMRTIGGALNAAGAVSRGLSSAGSVLDPQAFSGGYAARKAWDVLPSGVKDMAGSLASRAPKDYWHPTKTDAWGLMSQGLGFAELANSTLTSLAKFDTGVQLRYSQVSNGKVVWAEALTKGFTSNAGKVLGVAKVVGKFLNVTGVATSFYELQGTLGDPKATFGDKAWAWAKLGLNTTAFLARATPAGAALSIGLGVVDLFGWKP